MLCIIPTRLDWLCYGCAASRCNQKEPGGRRARGGVSKHTHTNHYHHTTRCRFRKAPGRRPAQRLL